MSGKKFATEPNPAIEKGAPKAAHPLVQALVTDGVSMHKKMKKQMKLRPVSPLPPEPQAQSSWTLGNSYASAAVLLMHEGKADTFIPTLFLFLHALELYLKSFLFSRGVSDRELRGVSHDLVACMRACRKHGLSKHVMLPRTAIVQVVRVNRYYSDKELEYFAPRAKSFGSIDTLAETVATVANGVFGPITEETFRAMSGHQPNPTFEKDCAKARSPSI